MLLRVWLYKDKTGNQITSYSSRKVAFILFKSAGDSAYLF